MKKHLIKVFSFIRRATNNLNFMFNLMFINTVAKKSSAEK